MSNKEGQPRMQFLKDPSPKTITVVHKDFDDDVMVINEDTFDPKVHKRCNEQGQLVNDRGVVLGTPAPVGKPKAEAEK